MRDILVGLLACGLVASAVAYGELQWWRGIKRLALYGVAGVMAAELGAAPLMWALLGLRSGLPETFAMALALGVGMATITSLVDRHGGQP